MLFVKVQATLAPFAVAAVFSVSTLPTSVAVPPEPMPVQEADARV
ncbi:MAG: hypothetical protein U1E15_07810 [Hyphomicrobiales bacterium]